MASYTSGEVSKLLDIPGSSLRRYVARFPEAFSAEARRQKGRRFSNKDFAVITRIKDLLDKGLLLEQIRPQIAGIIDQEPDQVEPPDISALALPGVIRRLNDFDKTATTQATEIAALRTRLEALEQRTAQPWYKRILRRKG